MLSPISISILSSESIGDPDTDTFAKSIGDTFASTFTNTFCCNMHSYLHYLAFPGDENCI